MSFQLKHRFLKISEDLQTALATEAHPAGGATEHRKVTMIQAVTRVSTVSRKEGPNLAPSWK
jgi:hypothetical protein